MNSVAFMRSFIGGCNTRRLSLHGPRGGQIEVGSVTRTWAFPRSDDEYSDSDYSDAASAAFLLTLLAQRESTFFPRRAPVQLQVLRHVHAFDFNLLRTGICFLPLSTAWIIEVCDPSVPQARSGTQTPRRFRSHFLMLSYHLSHLTP